MFLLRRSQSCSVPRNDALTLCAVICQLKQSAPPLLLALSHSVHCLTLSHSPYAVCSHYFPHTSSKLPCRFITAVFPLPSLSFNFRVHVTLSTLSPLYAIFHFLAGLKSLSVGSFCEHYKCIFTRFTKTGSNLRKTGRTKRDIF